MQRFGLEKKPESEKKKEKTKNGEWRTGHEVDFWSGHEEATTKRLFDYAGQA